MPTPTPVLRSHISEYSASAALFQCQHSTHQDGQVFIPNIPDLYFNHTYAADKINMLMRPRNGYTYYFTIPPESAERNCSGTVVAIQYCHRASQYRINYKQNVFSFRSVTRDDLVFTVTSSFTVKTTPLESECTEVPDDSQATIYLCCDTTTLSADNQLSISPESYTFGVTIVEHNVAPYAFTDDTEFVVEQFQGSAGNRYLWKVSGGLLLMRLIGNNMYNLAATVASMYAES